MGTYPTACVNCGQTFMWFSGNAHQLCTDCYTISADKIYKEFKNNIPQRELQRVTPDIIESEVQRRLDSSKSKDEKIYKAMASASIAVDAAWERNR